MLGRRLPMQTALQLARTREARGITLRQIADATHIGRPYLEAIESGDFAQLPHGVYAVSYIRQYAAAVGCDEAVLLAEYRRAVDPVAPAETVGPYLQFSKRARPSMFETFRALIHHS